MKRNWVLLLIVALMLCLLPGTTREAAAESKVLLKNGCVNCKEFRATPHKTLIFKPTNQ